MLDFKPPKPNLNVIKVVKAIMPIVNRWYLKGMTLDIDSESIERLESVRGNPTLISPNHAASDDPYVMFLLSKHISQPFYYMSAREVFDRGNFLGIRSTVMQRCGVYSVVRGTADRNAFRTTRELLVEGKWPLVIFGEGEISHQNDTVMRFERGVAQFCFWSIDDMKKGEIDKPLYLVPLGIKYRYTEDMWNVIDTALTNLERSILPSDARTPAERYQRLRRIGIAILSTLADEYQYKVDPTASLNQHIQGLKKQILSHVENILGIQADNDILTRVRALKNIVDAEVYRDIDEMTEYERKIHEEQLQKFQQFYPDLERLINFIAITDGYVAEEPSAERYLEVIFRLEKEVYGKGSMRGPRVASIRAGEPIDLLKYYNTYKTKKKETVEEITIELETEVRKLVAGI